MGCGFVSYQFHNSAKMAIETLNGTVIQGWTIRLSWGNAPVIPIPQPVMYYDPYYYYYPPVAMHHAQYYPLPNSQESSPTNNSESNTTQVGSEARSPENVDITPTTDFTEVDEHVLATIQGMKISDSNGTIDDDVKTL